MKRIKKPGHYYGLREIANRIGCSEWGVRSKIAKLHFPAFHVPSTNPAGGHGYEWYSNEWLINRWTQAQIESSWKVMAASATGKRLAYTREPDHKPDPTLTGTND